LESVQWWRAVGTVESRRGGGGDDQRKLRTHSRE
jgi:hypothetical protein